MRSLLKEATGVELPVVGTNAAPPSHRIFLGLAPKGYDVAALADQGGSCKTVDAIVSIASKGEFSSLSDAFETNAFTGQ